MHVVHGRQLAICSSHTDISSPIGCSHKSNPAVPGQSALGPYWWWWSDFQDCVSWAANGLSSCIQPVFILYKWMPNLLPRCLPAQSTLIDKSPSLMSYQSLVKSQIWDFAQTWCPYNVSWSTLTLCARLSAILKYLPLCGCLFACLVQDTLLKKTNVINYRCHLSCKMWVCCTRQGYAKGPSALIM